jgi:uncharacterized RDD family membrane protein YckC
LIDLLIVVAVFYPVFYQAGGWDRALRREPPSLDEQLLYFAIGVLVPLATNAYLLARHGQSVGKWILRIRIVDARTGAIVPLLRSFGLRHFVPIAIGYIPIAGSWLLLADTLFILRRDRRCLHDRLAGTKVVEAP